MADKFICHNDNFDGNKVDLWGLQQSIESEAIQNAKQCNQQRKNTKQSTMTGSARLDGSEVQFLFVRVSRLDNGANQYFLSNQNDLSIGETVQVPTGNGTASGIIIGLEWYTRSNAPQLVDGTPWLD